MGSSAAAPARQLEIADLVDYLKSGCKPKHLHKCATCHLVAGLAFQLTVMRWWTCLLVTAGLARHCLWLNLLLHLA